MSRKHKLFFELADGEACSAAAILLLGLRRAHDIDVQSICLAKVDKIAFDRRRLRSSEAFEPPVNVSVTEEFPST